MLICLTNNKKPTKTNKKTDDLMNVLLQCCAPVKYSMSHRLDMNTICNRCDSNNTTVEEKGHRDGEVDTYTYKVKCLDCGHEQ